MSKKVFFLILSVILIGFGFFFVLNNKNEDKEIIINSSNTELKIGSSYNINKSIDGETDGLEYYSENSDIAEIDNEGLIIAKKEGTTNIIIKNGNKKVKIRIDVKGDSNIKVDSIKLESCPESIKVGEKLTLKYSISPSNATNKRIIIRTSNNNIRAISSNSIQGISPGETMVSVKTISEGKSDFCLIKVVEKQQEKNTDEQNNKINSTPSTNRVYPTSQPKTIMTRSDTIEQENVRNIVLDKYDVKIKEGETTNLKYTIYPETAKNKTVSLKTENKNVATIDKKGIIKGINKGETKIIVTTEDGNYQAVCNVTVTKQEIKASRIVTEKQSYQIEKGNVKELNAIVEPKEATNKALKYRSSDNNIAVVDDNGVVYGVNPGTATVTISNKDVEKNIEIIVKEPYIVNLDKPDMSLLVGQKDRIRLINQYGEEIEANVKWSSSDDKIATVDKKGNVEAKSKGECVIVANYNNELIMSYVEVKEKEKEKIELNNSKYTLTEGQTYKLNATTNYETEITWQSTDPSIATVASDGTVTGIKEGKTEIIAKTSNGLEAKSIITVIKLNIEVKSIKLDKESISVLSESSTKLNATIEPSNATNKEITWQSTDPSIATVASDGTITTYKEGNVTVTASIGDKSASCKVYVVKPKKEQPEDNPIEKTLTINHSKYTLYEKGSFKLEGTVTPVGNDPITYSSTNIVVATVASDGTVTGLKEGTAEIIVKSNDLEKKCVVTVIKQASTPEAKPVVEERIKATQSKYDLNIGEIAKVDIVNQDNISVIGSTTIKNSNSSVASIDQAGNIKALSKGNTTIAFIKGNTTVYVYVTVKEIEVSSIKLNKTTETVDIKDTKTVQVQATVEPANATNKEVTWRSSNTNVATVSNSGLVTFKQTGSVIIYVTSNNGKVTTSCQFNIIDRVKQITIKNDNPMVIKIGESKTLEINEKIDRIVNWSIGGSGAIAIAQNQITGVKAGIETVTAQIDDARATVKVIVENLTLTGSNKMFIGDKQTLTATVEPMEAVNKSITYKSSNEKIATVDTKGVVTAKAQGTVTITASTKTQSKTINITVNPIAVQSIKLNKTNVILSSYNPVQLESTITPSNATNQNITWKSSDTSIATVTSYGKVDFKSPGVVTITATTADGNKQASCKFTILKDYKAAVVPGSSQKYVLTHLDSQELKDSSGTRHRLQQFDMLYNSNFSVNSVFYAFPEGKEYEKTYKMYFTQKDVSKGKVRTISYANGGHGAAFDILKIQDGIVSVYTDTAGTVNSGVNNSGEGLKVGLLNLNFKGQTWGTYVSYSDSNSSQSFTLDFGCYNTKTNTYNYGTECYNNHSTYNQLKDGYKSMITLTSYDDENNLMAFWSNNRQTVTVYRYSDLYQIINSGTKNVKLKDGYQDGISVNVSGQNIKPIFIFNTDDFAGIYRQGFAIHRGVIYGLWGKPKENEEIVNDLSWYIRGYDIRTGEVVYEKDIAYGNVSDAVSSFDEVEPEGMQVITNPNNDNAYVHFGIARIIKGKKSFSSVYRINGAS